MNFLLQPSIAGGAMIVVKTKRAPRGRGDRLRLLRETWPTGEVLKKDVAAAAGLQPNVISMIELGDNQATSIDVVAGLAKWAGVSIDLMESYLSGAIDVDEFHRRREAEGDPFALAAQGLLLDGTIDQRAVEVAKQAKFDCGTPTFGESIRYLIEIQNRIRLADVPGHMDAFAADRRNDVARARLAIEEDLPKLPPKKRRRG